jgi:hypothetical protein
MRVKTSALMAMVLMASLVGAQKDASWKFVVSGDSRNCGDIVVPAIAEGVKKDAAEFYWHLGDFRAIYAVDEDIANRAKSPWTKSLSEYQKIAWQDAIDKQLVVFGGGLGTMRRFRQRRAVSS